MQFQVRNLISKVNYKKKSYLQLILHFRNSRNGRKGSWLCKQLHCRTGPRKNKTRKETMGKGIENTYQCKQDCGISHFENHETHDFDVPRNKAMHLFDYNSHKPPNFHHFFLLPKQFLYIQICFHEWEKSHIQYTLKTKGRRKRKVSRGN